jgi:Transposase DDE domain
VQIVYGLLCAPDGCPVAIEVFDGNTGDPTTLAPQIDKLKQRFGLGHVVLVGDRGMITEARITEDIKSAGLDWITALRGPAIKDLLKSGELQLTLFDQRDMASITAPDFPGERLVVCRNPDLAAERDRKREDLLAATEKDLARIKTAVERKRHPLHGTAEIALAVGAVLNTYKMKKHFDLNITDNAFSYARKTAEIDAEAATDGLYILRTSLAAETLSDADTVRSYKSLPWPGWSGRFAASRRSIFMSGQSTTGCRIGCGRMSFSACWPTIWNGTCVSAWRRCCLMIPTRRRPKPCAAAWWRRHRDRRPQSRSKPPA